MDLTDKQPLNWFEIPLQEEHLHLGMAEICPSLSPDELHPDEAKEVMETINESRRAEILTSRLLLKKMAGKWGYPDDFHVLKNEAGKPAGFFKSGKCGVSISHSRNWVFGIIADTNEVGMDIEEISRKVNPSLKRRIFHGEEESAFKDFDLVRMWTIKESVLKLLGTGLRKNMSDVLVKQVHTDYFKTIVNQRDIRIHSFIYKKWWIAISRFE